LTPWEKCRVKEVMSAEFCASLNSRRTRITSFTAGHLSLSLLRECAASRAVAAGADECITALRIRRRIVVEVDIPDNHDEYLAASSCDTDDLIDPLRLFGDTGIGSPQETVGQTTVAFW